MRKLAVLAAVLAACSTTSGGDRGEQGTVHGTPVVVTNSQATFAASGSDAIAAAARTYPAWTEAAIEPPMSLTASDGTGLRLTTLDARAVIDGPLAFTELRMTFANPHDRVIEGRFAITLPEEAAISRLAMKIDGRWQEAEVVEKQLARRAYEDFLHRRQDPALLEKEAGNEFRARIFPIPARGHKEIIVSYSHELASSGEAYRLPLRGLPAIDRLTVTAMRGNGAAGAALAYETTRLDKAAYKPTADFELAQSAAIRGVAAGGLAVVRVTPALGAGAAPLSRARILLDTSASRAPGFGRQVERFGELVAALAAAHRGLDIDVVAFDTTSARIYRGPAAGFGRGQLDAIRARRPLGASDLGAALAAQAGADARERLIIVTDGVATAGTTEAGELTRALAATPGLERVDVVLVGGIRDAELARALAVGAAPRAGTVLDGDADTGELARRLGQTTVSGVTVAVTGADNVWPRRLDGVQPGDEVLVYASLEKPAAALEVVLGGAIEQTVRVPLVAAERPLVERALARATIAALTADRDALPAASKDQRAQLASRIVALSTRHRVMSDFTALLVLETDADYTRFGIDRKALADVLTVGPRGVSLEARADAVVIAAPAPDRTRRGPAKGKKQREKIEEDTKEAFDEGRLGKADPAEQPESKPASRDDDDDDHDEEPGDRGGDDRRDPAPPPAPRRAGPPPAAEPAPAGSGAEAGRIAPATTGVDVDHDAIADSEDELVAAEEPEEEGPPPLSGKLAAIMKHIADGDTERAVVEALAWRNEDAGDVMALIGLGEALEARGQVELAARVYGSIIDLYPSRADMRRMAAQRLERLQAAGAALAADALAKAAAQRPDHLTGHRQLAYALVRVGRYGDAFAALETGLTTRYLEDRFGGGGRILREDIGIVAAAWIAREPARRAEVARRLRAVGATLATAPSKRFVLSWETDANDVDFHIYDARGNHAFFRQMKLASGGELFHDVTNGYGPECFAIEGAGDAGPYRLRIHYYSRGPMGYGMGELEILVHDGKGTLSLESRPFVVMNDGAYVELGAVR